METRISIIFLVLVTLLPFCNGLLVGAGVIPHGDFAFDPKLLQSKLRGNVQDQHKPYNQAEKVHRACVALAKQIDLMKPDVIFLSTPHGMALSNDFALYGGNSIGSGEAVLGKDLNSGNTTGLEYTIEVKNVKLTTDGLLPDLQSFPNVTEMVAFGGAEDAPLAWGEVIPLKLLSQFSNSLRSGHTEVAVLSHPTRRLLSSAAMVPELLKLGNHVGKLLEHTEKRYVVLISSDLAHTHDASGPYGFSKAAEPFDNAMVEWLRSPRLDSLLRAKSYVDEAKSCGFPGVAMLHGIMENFEMKANFLGYGSPTYYGMMVGTFHRDSYLIDTSAIA